jgi:hypothetical protein
MSGKPFFALGLGVMVCVYLNSMYQARLAQERKAKGWGNESLATKRLGLLLKVGAVLCGVLLLGIVGWMSYHS